MTKADTGQWAGWLGAAVIAAAGGACFIALGSTGFVPEVPHIDFAEASSRPAGGAADATLRRIEEARAGADRAASTEALGGIVAGSREEAVRLLERLEAGEFDGTALEHSVAKSLLESRFEDVTERAMDALRRREVEYTGPRGGDAALEAVRNRPDPLLIEATAAEDLKDSWLLIEMQEIARLGDTARLRVAAIRALARAEEASITDFLIARLDWEFDADVRAAITLGLMIRPDAAAGQALAALLASATESDAVRRCAAEGLSLHGQVAEARTSLFDALAAGETNDAVRQAIVNSLGAIGSDPAVEAALIGVLYDDPCDAVRAAAATALVSSPSERACDALRHAIATSDSPDLRLAAEQALDLILQMTAAASAAPLPAGVVERRR